MTISIYQEVSRCFHAKKGADTLGVLTPEGLSPLHMAAGGTNSGERKKKKNFTLIGKKKI
jgi:hypothetical protein